MANHTPEYSNANDWFGSLPKEKQDFLRDSKWAMVNSAFEAGRDQLAAVTAQRDELLATMRKLACLGNGDQYGNSEGNTIAQEAIAKCEVQNGK